jgi:hypothetical protein
MLQRSWLNSLCRQQEVVECFMVGNRRLVMADQTFAGRSRVCASSRPGDHVPHFASTADFAWLEIHTSVENAIALGSIQNLTIEAHNDHLVFSFPCSDLRAMSSCFEQ